MRWTNLIVSVLLLSSVAYVAGSEVTFVASFFNLIARNSQPFKRPLDAYIHHSQLLLSHPGDYVFFCDRAACPTFVPLFLNRTVGQVTVVQIELEDLPAADTLPQYIANQGQYAGEVGKYYTYMVGTKPYLVVEAIKLNPYNSTSFVWVDMGLAHITPLDCIPLLARPWTKIRLMVTRPWPNSFFDGEDDMRAAMAAGVIAGSANSWQQMLPIYDAELRRSLARGWAFSEEVILPFTMKRAPHLFEGAIGTYTSLVPNFVVFQHMHDFHRHQLDQAVRDGSHSYGYHLCGGILDAYANNTLTISPSLEATFRGPGGSVVIPPLYLYKLYFNYFIHAYWTYIGYMGVPDLGAATPAAVTHRFLEFMRAVATTPELATLVYTYFDAFNTNFDFYPRFTYTNITMDAADREALYTPGVTLNGRIPSKALQPQLYLTVFNVQL